MFDPVPDQELEDIDGIAPVRADDATAFERISLPGCRCLFSLRSRRSTSRSAVGRSTQLELACKSSALSLATRSAPGKRRVRASGSCHLNTSQLQSKSIHQIKGSPN